MTTPTTLYQMIQRLAPADFDRVFGFVSGLANNALGRAECLCCGKVVIDAEWQHVCDGSIQFDGRRVACANSGGWWKFLGPERPENAE